MKTLTSLLSFDLPQWRPGDLAAGVMDAGAIRVLQVPAPPELLSCPMCAGAYGYRVRHTGGYLWACVSERCIARNGRQRLPRPKQPPAAERLAAAGVPALYRAADFADWRHPAPLADQLRLLAEEAASPALLFGRSGRGKTYAAVCMLASRLNMVEPSIFFADVPTVYQTWLADIKAPYPSGQLYRLTDCQLLVLDDLGLTSPSEGFLAFLYAVLNARYTAQKGTVVTSNLQPNDLEGRLGVGLAARILCGSRFSFEGGDMRIAR